MGYDPRTTVPPPDEWRRRSRSQHREHERGACIARESVQLLVERDTVRVTRRRQAKELLAQPSRRRLIRARIRAVRRPRVEPAAGDGAVGATMGA
jgi:hypothetical protein